LCLRALPLAVTRDRVLGISCRLLGKAVHVRLEIADTKPRQTLNVNLRQLAVATSR
jgi:hypothetical protein